MQVFCLTGFAIREKIVEKSEKKSNGKSVEKSNGKSHDRSRDRSSEESKNRPSTSEKSMKEKALKEIKKDPKVIMGSFVWNNNEGIKKSITISAEKTQYLGPLKITYTSEDKAFNVLYTRDNTAIVILNDKFTLEMGQNMIIFSGDKIRIDNITYRFEMFVL